MGFDLAAGWAAVPPLRGPYYFKVGVLSEGVVHKLNVAYNRPSAPLALECLFVQDGDLRIEDEWPPNSSDRTASPPDAAGSVLPNAAAISGDTISTSSILVASSSSPGATS